MIKFGYRKNEWLAVYVDDCGERQIMPFDTREEAYKYLTEISKVTSVIGIMTTAFYDNYIEKV